MKFKNNNSYSLRIMLMVVVFVVVGGVWEYCFSILKCCGLILGVGREGGWARVRGHRWAAERAHARLAVTPNLVRQQALSH